VVSNSVVRPTVAGAAPELVDNTHAQDERANQCLSLICEERKNDTFDFPLSHKTMDGFICVVIKSAPDFPFHPWPFDRSGTQNAAQHIVCTYPSQLMPLIRC